MGYAFDFTDKVVLITGGSRGLGRAMAGAFSACGASLVIASRKWENCRQVAADLQAAGGRALGVRCHVGSWEECDNLVNVCYAEFGRVDILINNAGMSPLYPSMDQVGEELFDKVIAVNLKGPFRLATVIGARMMVTKGGSIINLSSVNSVRPSPNAEPYGAAKAGLNALTRSLAHAYGPKVRVNAIMAGPFLTDISKAWDMDAFQNRAENTIPMRRGGKPEEIIGAALYLASDYASFTTGAILAVDGGNH